MTSGLKRFTTFSVESMLNKPELPSNPTSPPSSLLGFQVRRRTPSPSQRLVSGAESPTPPSPHRHRRHTPHRQHHQHPLVVLPQSRLDLGTPSPTHPSGQDTPSPEADISQPYSSYRPPWINMADNGSCPTKVKLKSIVYRFKLLVYCA